MYQLVYDDSVHEQVRYLPADTLPALQEVLTVLALTPWNGAPQHKENPTAEVRRWTFGPGGAGHVVYLILEDRREVHLLLVQWLA